MFKGYKVARIKNRQRGASISRTRVKVGVHIGHHSCAVELTMLESSPHISSFYLPSSQVELYCLYCSDA